MKRIACRAALLPTLIAALLGGCATAPEEPMPVVEPEVVQPEPERQPLVLKPDYPERYVVVRGDTLWDISERFLHDPWRWPELWQKNSFINNPHLIYPGDILTLIYIDGQPTFQVQRAAAVHAGRPTVRLSPKIRIEEIEKAIPTIPLDAIRPFLSRPRVVTREELDSAPYILSSADEHLIAATGNRVFVRGVTDPGVADYAVVRRGEVYVNPDDEDDILGYEAIHVGDARVVRFGDPATMLLTDSNREALNGDRLLPGVDETITTQFLPKAPDQTVHGRIISVVDGVSQIGQFQVVLIDAGLNQGMTPGDILAIYQRGETVRDSVSGDDVTLPDQRAGLMMVFRTFERMSYALVMRATRPIHILDPVTNP